MRTHPFTALLLILCLLTPVAHSEPDGEETAPRPPIAGKSDPGKADCGPRFRRLNFSIGQAAVLMAAVGLWLNQVRLEQKIDKSIRQQQIMRVAASNGAVHTMDELVQDMANASEAKRDAFVATLTKEASKELDDAAFFRLIYNKAFPLASPAKRLEISRELARDPRHARNWQGPLLEQLAQPTTPSSVADTELRRMLLKPEQFPRFPQPFQISRYMDMESSFQQWLSALGDSVSPSTWTALEKDMRASTSVEHSTRLYLAVRAMEERSAPAAEAVNRLLAIDSSKPAGDTSKFIPELLELYTGAELRSALPGNPPPKPDRALFLAGFKCGDPVQANQAAILLHRSKLASRAEASTVLQSMLKQKAAGGTWKEMAPQASLLARFHLEHPGEIDSANLQKLLSGLTTAEEGVPSGTEESLPHSVPTPWRALRNGAPVPASN